jgi:Phosphotransferase enzyme family
MSAPVITGVGQVDADWLTGALGRSGALVTGRVRDVGVDAESSVWSQIVRLRPRYEDDATGDLPAALLLKICAGEHAVFGPSEVLYYTRDYVTLADAPIPRCHDAQFSDTPRAYHILMDDLSATHTNTWQMAPTLERGLSAADALAGLHAHRWGPERLRWIGAAVPGRDEIARYVDHVRQGLEPLLVLLGDGLDPTWRDALHDVFAHHCALMCTRVRDTTGFTLVHGDVNPGNILAPRTGNGRVYLVDRQPFDWSLTTWLGVSDLAYMMVHWWDGELRRRWELSILRRYHEELGRRGVTGYAWDRLLHDYRLCAVQSVYVAVEWLVLETDRTRMRWVWEPQLHKAMTALFDLRCAELWTEPGS